MIPKIVHQTAPENRNTWHPVWNLCQESWKNNFVNHEHIIWTDEEGIDNLVKEHYNDYFDIYNRFTASIIKIDFAKLCMMHKFGGIYADMDFYCFTDFSDELVDGINCVQSPDGLEEKIQNSFFASVPNQQFFIDCMDLTIERFLEKEEVLKEGLEHYKEHNDFSKIGDHVIYVSGPLIITNVMQRGIYDINELPRELYNPNIMDYNEDFKMKHMSTGIWGSECMPKVPENEMLFTYLNMYRDFRKVDILSYEFDKKYI